MKSVKFSKPLKLLLSLSAIVTFAPFASAQDSGYAPPPMFDDMTPPMVRPQTSDGNIVAPKASPNTVLPAYTPNAKPVIVPRVSVDPDSPRAATAPVPAPALAPAAVPQTQMPAISAPPVVQAPVPGSVTTTTTSAPAPQLPVVSPAKPKMMQPIIEAPKPKPKVIKPKVKKPDAPVPKPPSKPEIKAPEIVAPKVDAPEVKAPETKIDMPSAPATPVVPTPPPVKEESKVVTPPQPAPIAPEPEPIVTPAPKIGPVKRDPKESAIKGPKTMPALPTETIDQQKTFEAKEAKPEETILERHQHEAKKEELKAIVPAPKADVAPASFDTNKEGALKKTIPFAQGQIGLSSADIDPIAVAVNKELDAEGKKDWRVQIRAYATPYGTGVSSDKRIALSRALSLRSALIAQGVPAARIDVLAEGLQSDNLKQSDRIDLYMYGPVAG